MYTRLIMPGSRVAALPPPLPGRVFVVDDDAPVRRALSRLLRSATLEVESFASAEGFLAGIAPDPGPACVVVDLNMPGLTGLQLQDELRRRGLDLPLVFISGQADVSSSVRAMKSGALDFIEKPFSDDEFLGAVAQALEQDSRNRERREERRVLDARRARLTPREREVFELVVEGLGNKQVGWQLGATEKTIKVHRARVMEKMEAGSLAELVRMSETLASPATEAPHRGRA
jgi:RNA polymerase sigma factor (sigma-70 family)